MASVLNKLKYPGRDLEKEDRIRKEADAAAAKYAADIGEVPPEEAGIEEGNIDMLIPDAGSEAYTDAGWQIAGAPSMRAGLSRPKTDLNREKIWNRLWEMSTPEGKKELLTKGKDAVVDAALAAEKQASVKAVRTRKAVKSNKNTAEEISYGRKEDAFGSHQDAFATPSVSTRKPQ